MFAFASASYERQKQGGPPASATRPAPVVYGAGGGCQNRGRLIGVNGDGGGGGVPGADGGVASLGEALALAQSANFVSLLAGVTAGVLCLLGSACALWWCRTAVKRKSRTAPGLDFLRASAAASESRGGGGGGRAGTATKGATTELAPSWKVREKGSASKAALTLFGGGAGGKK